MEAGSHNLTLTVIGSVLIWAGWYSFVNTYDLIYYLKSIFLIKSLKTR